MSEVDLASAPSCTDLEALAAYLDGRLSAPARRRLEAHLADCDACRELFADSPTFLAAEGGRPAVVPLPARPWHRQPRKWLLAAVVVLAVGGGVWTASRFAASAARPGAARLAKVASLAGSTQTLGDDWSQSPWGVTRGAEPPTPAARGLVVRLGARSADLRLALALGDRPRAQGLARELAALAARAPFAEPVAVEYRELARRLAPEAPAADLARDADRAASALVKVVDEALFDLGYWSESERLAHRALPEKGDDEPTRPFPSRVPSELTPWLSAATSSPSEAAFTRLLQHAADLE